MGRKQWRVVEEQFSVAEAVEIGGLSEYVLRDHRRPERSIEPPLPDSSHPSYALDALGRFIIRKQMCDAGLELAVAQYAIVHARLPLRYHVYVACDLELANLPNDDQVAMNLGDLQSLRFVRLSNRGRSSASADLAVITDKNHHKARNRPTVWNVLDLRAIAELMVSRAPRALVRLEEGKP